LFRVREAFQAWRDEIDRTAAIYETRIRGPEIPAAPSRTVERAVSAFAGCLTALVTQGRITAGDSLGSFVDALLTEFRLQGRFDGHRDHSARDGMWALIRKAFERMEGRPAGRRRYGTDRGAAYYTGRA